MNKRHFRLSWPLHEFRVLIGETSAFTKDMTLKKLIDCCLTPTKFSSQNMVHLLRSETLYVSQRGKCKETVVLYIERKRSQFKAVFVWPTFPGYEALRSASNSGFLIGESIVLQ